MSRLAWLACAVAAFAQTPPPSPAPAGEVTGVGNFSHIVTNLEKSVEFYHDVLGLDISIPPREFSPNPAIMKLGNTLGAQSRISVLKVPGSALGVELIEYKDIDRKPAHPRFQDPGAANLGLQVRNIDVVFDRLKKSGAHIITAAGQPVAIGAASRNIFVQDPDGFVVEVAQRVPAPEAAGASNVLGGGFEVAIANTEESVKFYRDLFGFNLRVADAFNDNKLMAETAGTPGAQFRQSAGQIPGTPVRFTLIEFKGIDRKPLNTRVQDPGTALLQLRVKDLDSLLKKLKAAGVTVTSTGGEPVDLPQGHLVIVRDPNNLFLELMPAISPGL